MDVKLSKIFFLTYLRNTLAKNDQTIVPMDQLSLRLTVSHARDKNGPETEKQRTRDYVVP